MRGQSIDVDLVSEPDPQPVAATVAGPALIAILLASVGFGLIAMAICLPSMPQWRSEFGVPLADVQLTFSLFVIGLGFAQLLYGPLSDRHGRRTLLMIGFLLAALGSLAAAFAPNLGALIVARFVQGTGAAAGMVIGRAMVQDYFSGADRPRVMAFIGMVMGMCPPAGTVIGGQLHVAFGWRANFVFTAGLALVLLVAIWRVLPAAGARAPEDLEEHWVRAMLRAYAALLRVPAYRAYAVILGMCSGSFYVFLSGAPTTFASYGADPAAVGLYIALIPLSYIAGNFLTSRCVARVGEARLMLVGQFTALLGIALVLILAKAGLHAPWALALPLLLLGLGHGFVMPSTLAGTVSVVPALAGAAAGMAGLAQQLAGAFGGYAVGLVSHHDAANLALLMFAFMLVSLYCQLILRRDGVLAPA